MKLERLVEGLIITGVILTAGCHDSRESLLTPEQSHSEVSAIPTRDVPERPPSKWARMSDAELERSVEDSGGRVIIGIKESGSNRGVYRGTVLTSTATYAAAKEDLIEAGARVVHEFQLSPVLVGGMSPQPSPLPGPAGEVPG